MDLLFVLGCQLAGPLGLGGALGGLRAERLHGGPELAPPGLLGGREFAGRSICYNSNDLFVLVGGQAMVQMTLEISEEALAALRKAPQEFVRELRLAAAVKWYELKLLSQERAANVAGLSRAEFLGSLGRFAVTPYQYGSDEILQEAGV
jgi:predicted HTH domain antitoxin